MLPADMRSRAGDSQADRGLRAMQHDQQSVGGRSANVSNSANARKQHAFQNKRRWVRDPTSASEQGPGEEYGHLSQFLQE